MTRLARIGRPPLFLRIFGLPLLLLMGIAPLVAWRRASLRGLVRTFVWPAGVALATGVLILMRCYWLARLFPTFALFSHAARAMWPTVPALVAVLLIREAETGPRTAAHAAVEALAFVIALAIGVFVAERNLMREVIGYLRGGAVSRSTA